MCVCLCLCVCVCARVHMCNVLLSLLALPLPEVVIPASEVQGKCLVVFGEDLQCGVDEYFLQGPDRFYFTEVRGCSIINH